MKFTVVWLRSAENELIQLWSNATDRAAITRAVNALDAVLARYPKNVGESRDDAMRIAIVDPVAIHFEVNDGDRIVRVSAIWLTRGNK